MIIGIDIDDTISHTNDKLIEAAYKFDMGHVKGKGYKNKNAYSFMEIFYWSVIDVDRFLDSIRNSKFFLEVEPIKDSVEYINKMYDEGNKIIFITRRQNSFKVKHMTKKWLKSHGYKYHKLVLGAKYKGEICDNEGVSFFVDNDLKNVLAVKDYNIEAVLMGDNYNKDENEVERVSSWKEIYKKYKEVLKHGKNS